VFALKKEILLKTNNGFKQSRHVHHVKFEVLRKSSTSIKDPTTSLIVSILAGSLGIDRFIIGDTGLGIGKLLTCGGFGIWAIVDWFMIQKATREKNMQKIQHLMY
jgi:TM2 domain-containing membrane protein YozV